MRSRRLGLAKIFGKNSSSRDSPLIMLVWDIGQNFGRIAAKVTAFVQILVYHPPVWYSFIKSCIHDLLNYATCFRNSIRPQILHSNRYKKKPQALSVWNVNFNLNQSFFLKSFDRNLNTGISHQCRLLRFWSETMNSNKLVILNIAKWNIFLKAKLSKGLLGSFLKQRANRTRTWNYTNSL